MSHVFRSIWFSNINHQLLTIVVSTSHYSNWTLVHSTHLIEVPRWMADEPVSLTVQLFRYVWNELQTSVKLLSSDTCALMWASGLVRSRRFGNASCAPAMSCVCRGVHHKGDLSQEHPDGNCSILDASVRIGLECSIQGSNAKVSVTY